MFQKSCLRFLLHRKENQSEAIFGQEGFGPYFFPSKFSLYFSLGTFKTTTKANVRKKMAKLRDLCSHGLESGLMIYGIRGLVKSHAQVLKEFQQG